MTEEEQLKEIHQKTLFTHKISSADLIDRISEVDGKKYNSTVLTWEECRALIAQYEVLKAQIGVAVESEKFLISLLKDSENLLLKMATVSEAIESQTKLSFVYKNHKGETLTRTAYGGRLRYTSTQHHPEEQWIWTAVDVKKGARNFAVKDIEIIPKQEEKQ